ncbi:TetR/AcrR family transcriptional regulator [Roseobacter sp. N2S]|uniref:TetR/AcrR family transcriptional regulator n=1 Tax=Roseobacter sp. N2S TaxID=2663844 RepID=UPI0028651B1B|nr:TetR/AcrR family transcriptional regulator [Roseobacter sp. N2S]MDR6265850.1 AcrR family transcriptional regulator [Roseobacter sp. N2S]
MNGSGTAIRWANTNSLQGSVRLIDSVLASNLMLNDTLTQGVPDLSIEENAGEGSLDMKDEIAEYKRKRILEAAISLFDAHGFSQTTVHAIAKDLGYTKPFVYSYFPNKTQILVEICLLSLTQSKAAIDTAVTESDTPRDQLRAAVEGLALAVIDNQKSVNIFDREEKYHDEETRKVVLDYQGYLTRMLTRIITEGNQRGDFDCDDIPSAVFAIGGMVSWIRRWYVPSGRLGREAVAAAQGDIALRIVREAPPN